ncbi:MAG TPA: NERD domain-containing protein [Streptosporangiaceae bacterium]
MNRVTGPLRRPQPRAVPPVTPAQPLPPADPADTHPAAHPATATVPLAATRPIPVAPSRVNAYPQPAAEPGMTGILGQDQVHRTWAGGTPLAALRTDPRLHGWVRRSAVSVGAGIALTILTDWRVGITVAVLAAVADSLYHARTRGVIPAAARATSAQRRTRRRLARLAPAGYVSLYRRLIPGTGVIIDHLVIGPAGVYAVGSQHWDRRLPVRATRSGQLFHGPFEQTGELADACWRAGQAGGLIGAALGQPVTVRPALVIYGPTVPWIVVKAGGVDVFCGRRLRTYLRREAGAARARRLDERQIELIHAAAAQALPPVG